MQFHLLSFEGPDDYARAGGIATRITGLAQALAAAGYETHLWFIGDPDRPGHDSYGQLTLTAGVNGSAATTRPGSTMAKRANAAITRPRCRRICTGTC
jgi:hypothetical protein